MYKMVVLLLILLKSSLAMAADIPLYEGAVLVDESVSDQGLHRLILEKNRRIQGNWQFEREQRIAGRIEHRTYQMDSSINFRRIVSFYQDWIKTADMDVLFACEGRDCGSSNVWANYLFSDRRLYGPDGNQYYWALSLDNVFYMLYLIEQGNQRIYLRVSRIIPEGVNITGTLQLDKDCQHPELADFLQKTQDGPFLLLASISGDEDQSRSIALARRCAKVLADKTYRQVNWLGLGAYDRQLGRVYEDSLELIIEAP